MSVELQDPPTETRGFRYKPLLKVAVSAGILGVLAWKTDWEHVAAAVRGLRWSSAAAAFGVLVAAQVVSALRWQWLARPLGFDGPLRRYVGFYFVGMFFNLLLPTSVGGDVVRAVYLNGGNGRPMEAGLSVLLDRLSGLLVMLAVACGAALVCPVPLPLWVTIAVGGSALAAVVGLALSPWVARFACRLAPDSKLAGLAASVQEALAVYRREPRLIASSTVLSAVVQASGVLQVALIGHAVGLDVSWAVYGVAGPMVALLTLLPVSLNGMGLREAGMVVFLAPAGVPAGSAVTVAFLWFLVQSAAGLLGAGVYLAGRFPRPEVPHDDVVGDRAGQGRAGQRRSAA